MKYDDLAAFDTPTIDPQTRACLNLWAEVFRVGLVDAADYYRQNMEMPYWMKSDEREPGRFAWLCDLFDMDPDIVRSKWRMNLRAIVRRNKDVAEIKDDVRTEMETMAPAHPMESHGDAVTLRSNLRRSELCR